MIEAAILPYRESSDAMVSCRTLVLCFVECGRHLQIDGCSASDANRVTRAGQEIARLSCAWRTACHTGQESSSAHMSLPHFVRS